MPVDVSGVNSIINAYLKGVALRQQKERDINQLEIERGAQELRQQQIDQQLDIANRRFDEYKRRTDLEDKARSAAHELNRFKAATAFQQGIKDNLVVPVDPKIEMDPFKPDTWRFTTPEERQKTKITGKVEEAKAMLPLEVEKAGKVEQAKVPAQANLAGIRSDLALRNQQEQNKFTAEEKAKDRENRLAIAAMRQATGQADMGEYLEARLEQIKHGDLTKEQIAALPSKERNMVTGEAARLGYIPIETKKLEKLSEVNDLNLFIDKSEELHNLIKSKGNVAAAWASGEVRNLANELDALAKTFAVNIAGDRSILSEKEVPRIQGGIVQINPSGRRILNPFEDTSKINIAANERRLQDFKNTYEQRIKELYGNISKAQRDALNERFGVKKYSKPDNLKKSKSTGLGKIDLSSPDFELMK